MASNDYSLLILAYLIEDVIVLQTLNAGRKRDIQSTLLLKGNQLIEYIESFLDLPATMSSSLYALTMFATFLPIEIFFSTKIIYKIVLLLNSSVHRMKAAEFLSVIADRTRQIRRTTGITRTVRLSLSTCFAAQRSLRFQSSSTTVRDLRFHETVRHGSHRAMRTVVLSVRQ